MKKVSIYTLILIPNSGRFVNVNAKLLQNIFNNFLRKQQNIPPSCILGESIYLLHETIFHVDHTHMYGCIQSFIHTVTPC